MKKQFKSLLLVAIFACTTLSAWSQSSTEGKDFWLAATIVCQPPSASTAAVPYIAISAKEACVVSITDYQGNSVVTQHGSTNVLQQIPLGAGSWTEFGNTNATVQLYDIDPSKWYPSNNVISAGDVYKHADEKNHFGLHVTSDKDISVFVILRAKNSMDASNILPVSAIQSEYYTQDYWPYAKDVSTNVTMATILAIEDNTIVDITPKGDTYGKNNSGQKFNITLNKGETYYLMSKAGQQLAGTHIKAQNEKKIAVYNGCPLTTVPVSVSARDGMYEQSMPIDYWGTEFIVSRSKNKDGNIIGITASNDGTDIFIDGDHHATIEHAGDTYYFMLQSIFNPNSKKPGDKPLNTNDVFTADVAYIRTSCPCAVYSYDTGNSFVYSKEDNENLGSGDNRYGDPSSVWISPIQQTIREITFGTCYTNETKMHYLNVVTETSTCHQTTLAYRNGTTMTDCSNLLEWNVVDGNQKYSYARAMISNNEPSKNVFTLKNPSGFIAHIYGNGDDESYAYSAGSAAVEMGINVNGVTFTDGYHGDEKFCIADSFAFDAAIGTDEIQRVDWEFGDGTSLFNGPVQIMHQYAAPGWYDVSARLYGRQVCTNNPEMELGTVSFSFRVVRQDTVTGGFKHECISVDGKLPDGTQLTEEQIADLLANGGNDTTFADCPNDVVINIVDYGRDSEYEYSRTEKDSVYMFGKWYYASQTVEGTIENASGCDSLITCHLTVITSLDISVVQNDYHICPGEELELAYKKTKGDIQNPVLFIVPGVLDAQEVNFSNDNTLDGTPQTQALPTTTLSPGKYHGELRIVDKNAQDTLDRWFDFTVNYPDSVFKYKYNNVLAVYKPGRGGNDGWTFIAYQWYRNGDAIPGATQSVYHVDSTFVEGDVYYVELTDDKGVTIPSCEQTIDEVPVFDASSPAAAPARKILVNRRMVIYKDDKMYDIYGQRVQ